MYLALAFILGLLAAPVWAQQPSPEDMRTAYEAAVAQRNRAQNDQIEMAVVIHKIQADYEIRLETVLQWLKAAQAK
jgi:hypothetical protein